MFIYVVIIVHKMLYAIVIWSCCTSNLRIPLPLFARMARLRGHFYEESVSIFYFISFFRTDVKHTLHDLEFNLVFKVTN